MTPGAVLLFDGDCAFCSSTVRVAERWIRHLPQLVPYQRADLEVLGVNAIECAHAVQWVAPDGRRAAGERAVAQVLVDAGRGWGVLGRAMQLPGLSWLAALAYRCVSRNRHRLPGGTAACSISPDAGARRSGG